MLYLLRCIYKLNKSKQAFVVERSLENVTLYIKLQMNCKIVPLIICRYDVYDSQHTYIQYRNKVRERESIF
jgi:hypothetical protein